MLYFNGVNNLTELQEKRIKLLQQSPNEAARINGEFMLAKDAIVGKRNRGSTVEQLRECGMTEPSVGYTKKRLQRINYKVEVVSDTTTYVELRGDCIYVSPPPYQAFNAEYLHNQSELPIVETAATMAFFIPPLTDVPIYCFT